MTEPIRRRKEDSKTMMNAIKKIMPVLGLFLAVAGIAGFVYSSVAASPKEVDTKINDHEKRLFSLEQRQIQYAGDIKDIKDWLLKLVDMHMENKVQ